MGTSKAASVLILLLLLLATPSGCNTARPDLARPDQMYTTRGRVERWTPGTRRIQVHHESLPGFVDADGRKVGMKAMSMSFSVAPDLDLEGVKPGDTVKLTFEVRHDSEPTLLITRLEELPPGTALQLDR